MTHLLRSQSARREALGLFIAGYDSAPEEALPSRVQGLLREGLAGVILFRRNLPDLDAGGMHLARLVEQTQGALWAAPEMAPPFVCVDQEGGRVERLREPFTRLPPMRLVGEAGAEACALAGEILGLECAAAGFNVDFTPVADVDTNPANPVIGDRAFSSDAREVGLRAGALLDALQAQGVLGCLKHFPGHGDTMTDSHLELPMLPHDLARLDRVELVPFAQLRGRVRLVMTAHVLFPALDPELPATLSPRVLQALLRKRLGYGGLVVSDDLDMKAITDRFSPERSVELGLLAGCNLFLACRREDVLEGALEAVAKHLLDGTPAGARARESLIAVGRLRRTLARGEPSVRALRELLASDAHRDRRARLGRLLRVEP